MPELINYSVVQLQNMLVDAQDRFRYIQPNTQDYHNNLNIVYNIQAAIEQKSKANGYIVPGQSQGYHPQVQQSQGYHPQVQQPQGYQPYTPTIPMGNSYNYGYTEPTPQTGNIGKNYNKYSKNLPADPEPEVHTKYNRSAKQSFAQPVEPTYTVKNYEDEQKLDIIKFELLPNTPFKLSMEVPFLQNDNYILSYNRVKSDFKIIKYNHDDSGENETLDFSDTSMEDLVNTTAVLCKETDKIGVAINHKLTRFVNRYLKYMVNGSMDNDLATDIKDLVESEHKVTDIDTKLKIRVLKEILLNKIRSTSIEIDNSLVDKVSLVTCSINMVVVSTNVNLGTDVNTWLVSNVDNPLYKGLDTISKECDAKYITLVSNNKEYDVVKYHECYIILGEYYGDRF